MEDKNVWEVKDRRICRQSCIKSAIECVNVCGGEERSLKRVLEIAKEFENYVYGAI